MQILYKCPNCAHSYDGEISSLPASCENCGSPVKIPEEQVLFLLNMGKSLIEDSDEKYLKPLAVDYFKDAAICGSLEAKEYLGVMFFEGIGVKKDRKTAYLYLYDAYDCGSGLAAYYISLYHFNGIEFPKDTDIALRYVLEAVDRGYVPAVGTLASFYESGISVKKDLRQAFLLYKKAAEGKDADSMANLGRCFEEGIGTEVDKDKALYWYHASQHAGSSLGDMLYRFLAEELGVDIEDPDEDSPDEDE